MLESAMDFLQRKPVHYGDMIASLAMGQGEVLLANEAGVLVFDSSAQLHLLTVEKSGAKQAFIEKMKDAALVAVHQADLLVPIAQRFGLRPTMRCYQGVWTKGEGPSASPSNLDIIPLAPEMAEKIRDLYSHDIGLNYIRGRLEKKELFGGFCDGVLAGFIGLHEEGSMGMLEVLPAFRGLGYGQQLLAWLCKRQLALGRIPFSQFTEENIPSYKLHERMGFSISSELVYLLEP